MQLCVVSLSRRGRRRWWQTNRTAGGGCGGRCAVACCWHLLRGGCAVAPLWSSFRGIFFSRLCAASCSVHTLSEARVVVRPPHHGSVTGRQRPARVRNNHSAMASITPEEVCKFKKPTDGFLCKLSDNVFGIDFLAFTIKDYDTKRKIFHVDRESSMDSLAGVDLSTIDEDSLRKIDYKFESDVLSLPRIVTRLKFSVGDNVVQDFRMIERHYFKGRLIKSFDFTFPFCIPKSTNTWTSEYELPPMDAALVDEIVKSPNQTQSDSFYFVQGKLIMHNKARYTYFYPPGREAKLEGKLGGGPKAGEGKSALSEGKSGGGGGGAKSSAGEGKFSGK